MSDWMDEVETLETICSNTKDCRECKLGYCIKPQNVTNDTANIENIDEETE